MIPSATVQGIKVRNPFGIEADNLSVNNGRPLDASRRLNNERIALRPLRAALCKEPHPPVADMNLKTVAIMLEFMHPAFATRRLLGDGRAAGLDESGRRVYWPAARGTHTRQHEFDITDGPNSNVQAQCGARFLS